jgi:hypothetical protein
MQGMARLKNFYEKKLKELEETLADTRSIAAAKDKHISRIIK